MVEIAKSVLVGYSAGQMFALVDAVEAYPQFLPWCSGTDLIYRDTRVTRATIHINCRGVRQSFTTENQKSEPAVIQIKLIEGPFRALEGSWRFKELSSAGCRVELSLRYEFSTQIFAALIGPVFGYIANTMIDAFVKRAQSVYG